MIVLGIETSCDECSAAIVEDGSKIISNCIASQVDIHRPYQGVVPEIASRTHTEWIVPVVNLALKEAGLSLDSIDGIAVTSKPGLIGSLLVGLSFAKGLSFALGVSYVAVDHILAHLYAPHLESEISYPYLGLIVSGGHTIICEVSSFDEVAVLGTTIDDACGEAFDKVAKHHGFGHPGGPAIDKLARLGNAEAFSFPNPSLHKGEHKYDVSYSGLKTAVINQMDQFHNMPFKKSPENIAAGFEKAAIDLLTKRLFRAAEDTGHKTLVVGGGVAANSYLREQIGRRRDLDVFFPSMRLCTDNGAMIAGIGYQYLSLNRHSELDTQAFSRVSGFRKTYP